MPALFLSCIILATGLAPRKAFASATLSVVLLLCSNAQAAIGDVYHAVNATRALGADCAATSIQPPLAIAPQLERAAAAIAQGTAMAASILASGFRTRRALYIGIDAPEHEQVPLLSTAYCGQVLDASSTAMGAFQSSDRLILLLATAFDPVIVGDPQQALSRMLALVNEARATARDCGGKRFDAAGPVRWNSALAQAARAHAESLAQFDYMGHDGHDGSTPAQRVARAGYDFRVTGENIASGPSTADDAVAVLLASPTHCAVMMAPWFDEMGAALAVNKDSEFGVYWVQEFGAGR